MNASLYLTTSFILPLLWCPLYARTRQEAANYAGLTPVLYCSGDTARYGHIQRGGYRALRSIILQSAWAVSRSSGGEQMKEKFQALSGRMNKTKSAVDGRIDVDPGETPPDVR